MGARRLPLRTRLAAWIWTGPAGHLYGGLLDWAELLLRLALARARGHARGTIVRLGR